MGLDEGLLKTGLINVHEQGAAIHNCGGAWRKLVPAWERNPPPGWGHSLREVLDIVYINDYSMVHGKEQHRTTESADHQAREGWSKTVSGLGAR